MRKVQQDLTRVAFSRLADERDDFALNHIYDLVQSLEDVIHLDRAIIGLAVTGKLTTRDATDQPGAEVAAELEAEEASPPAYVKVRSSWAIARLASVANVRLGRSRSPERAFGERMRPYLRVANLSWAGLNATDVKEMAFTEAESKVYELQYGDLLLNDSSGSPGEVGKTVQFRDEISECCYQNHLIRVRLKPPLNFDFYEWYLRYEALSGRFAGGVRGGGIQHLGLKNLAAWPVPIPPIKEQVRIVLRLEELLALTAQVRDAFTSQY